MKILVVDDHPLIQQALAQSLPHLHGMVEVIAAVDREETLTALARHPDCALVLLDLTLPGAHGLDLLVQLRRDFPALPVVVLSATHDRATIDASMAAGAHGYIAKSADAQELLRAVRAVIAGRRPVTSDIAPRAAAVLRALAPGVLGLTARQADVLRLLAQGKPNKMICRDLNLSEGTVKVHVSAILKALNVHSRTQAVVEIVKRGASVESATRQ